MRYGGTGRQAQADQRRVRLSYREHPEGPDRILPFIIGLVGDFAPGARMPCTDGESDLPTFIPLEDHNVSLALATLKPSLNLALRDPDASQNPPERVLLTFQKMSDFEPAAIILGCRACDDAAPPLALQIDLVDRLLLAAIQQAGMVDGAGLSSIAATMRKVLPAHLRDLVEKRQEILAKKIAGGIDPDIITWALACLDRRLGQMVTDLRDNPAFQALEAAWRGVDRLASCFAGSDIRLSLLPWTKAMLVADLERVFSVVNPSQPDQRLLRETRFYKRISPGDYYGGQAFGLICLDMALGEVVAETHLMHKLAQLGEMVSSPIVAAAAPQLLNLGDFGKIASGTDLRSRLAQLRQERYWQNLRQKPVSRFLSLLLPRMLARPERSAESDLPLPFANLPQPRPLWQNPIYALAEVAGRAYQRDGWVSELTGMKAGRVRYPGGATDGSAQSAAVVHNLPATEFVATEEMEDAIAETGLLPLTACQGRPFAAFFRANSLHYPDGQPSRPLARMQARLPLVMAACRITHYLRAIGQQVMGQGAKESALEHKLNQWLSRYTANQDDAAPEIRARQPLRRGEVRVRPHPEQADQLEIEVCLQPHFQFDELDCDISLTAPLERGATLWPEDKAGEYRNGS